MRMSIWDFDLDFNSAFTFDVGFEFYVGSDFNVELDPPWPPRY